MGKNVSAFSGRVRIVKTLCPWLLAGLIAVFASHVAFADTLPATTYTTDQTLTADRDIPGNLYIKGGTTNLNGYRMTVGGSVIVSAGILNIGGGQLVIVGDLRIQTENPGPAYSGSSGYLKMVNPADSVQVQGSFVMQSCYSHFNYLMAGIMEVGGHFSQIRYSSSAPYTDNFFASGTHMVVLNGTVHRMCSSKTPEIHALIFLRL